MPDTKIQSITVPVDGGGTGTYYLSDGDAVQLTGNQTIAGTKTFSDGIVASSIIAKGNNTSYPFVSYGTTAISATTAQGVTKTYNLPSATGTLALTGDIPTVSDATITIKQSGISDQTFTLNGPAKTITLVDTTYESKAAVSGGTAVSLVTTGEKYTWNNKQNAITDGSATIASVSSDVVTLKAGITQSSGAISNSTGSDITLAKVAKTGSYADLSNIPTNLVTTDGAQTISALKTITAAAGIKMQYVTNGYTEYQDGAIVYKSPSNNTPYVQTIQAKNGTLALTSDIQNGQLTIQNNGTNIAIFSANASTAVTANLITPQVYRYI